MPKYVRVRLDNGTEKTVSEAAASNAGLKPLDKPTHSRDGRILPPKPRVELGTASAAAKSTSKPAAAKSSADSSKEK